MTGETTADGPRVLIAEDERMLAKAYGRFLEECEVTVVYDGAAALEAYDDHDVVLLDRMMLEYSGGEVLSALRDRGVDVPVAVVTAVSKEVRNPPEHSQAVGIRTCTV